MAPSSACTITARVSGPCDACGVRAEPAHLIETPDTVQISIALYCERCCPAKHKPANPCGILNRDADAGPEPNRHRG